MNKLLIASLIAFASAGVSASEVTVFEDHVVGQVSRAEVRAELMAALAAGEPVRAGEASIATAPVDGTALTRKQVRDEVRAALARGERLRFGEARV